MLKEFQHFISKNHLFKQEEKILLAVSGGVDSVVMADLFRKAGFKYAIAHCNFGLRGKASELDLEFVRKLAREHKVKFHSKVFKTESYSKKESLSVQEAARELRYSWFRDLCIQYKYKTTATAHHHDDSIETFFINLFRGTGIAGLTGITRRGDQVIRPLLFATREDLMRYAKAEKIIWREDESNASGDYLRNRIRQQLLPIITQIQPSFREKMKLNFEQLQLAASAYHEKIQLLKKKFIRVGSNGQIIVQLSSLKKTENPETILSALLHSFGIFEVNTLSILKSTEPGKIFTTHRYRILRDRSRLYIEEIKAGNSKKYVLPNVPGELFINENTLRASLTASKISPRIFSSPGIHLCDAKKVKFPLTIRHWKAGDFFYPLGMSHRKKLSDFLVDNKLNRFEKEKCMVVVSGKDIVCILGHRIDDRFKVTPETKKVLKLEFITDIK